MTLISKTPVIAVAAFTALFAAGTLIGSALPSFSNSSTADFINSPGRVETNPNAKKRRIVRVVEQPVQPNIACDASTSPEDTSGDTPKEKFVYKNGNWVKTKTCQPSEVKTAKMPNLFKQ